MKLTKTAWVLHICTWRHLPLWNHDHLCHCSRLDLQTQEKAVETPNLQLDQQNIQFTSSPTRSQNVQSSPSAPPSFNWPCYRAYTHSKIWLSKRDCFFCPPENHFNVIIVWWETAYKMQLLQIKKKNPTLDWALRVTDPGQFCRHQLVLHFERRVIPFLIIKNTFL